MDGWFKTHRKLWGNSMFQSLNSKQRDVLFTCLYMANYAPKEWQFEGKIYKCQPGQFVTSLNSISKNCAKDVTIQTIRTALNKLETWNFLTSKSTNRGRLITICKWDTYQNEFQETNKPTNKKLTSNQQATNKQTNKQLTTREEVKKEEVKKFYKEKKPYEKFYADCYHKTSNEQYRKFIMFLMKKNNTEEKLKMVTWSIKGQINEKRFLNIMELSEHSPKLIARVCENMHNDNKHKYIDFYLTLLNWIKRELKEQV